MATLSFQQKANGSKKSSKIPIPVWRSHIVTDVCFPTPRKNDMLEDCGEMDKKCPHQNRDSECLTSKEADVKTTNSVRPNSSTRVNMLLNNELFKKHLAKHADFLRQHTLSAKRFGLRKTVSNIDLSSTELQQSLAEVNDLQKQIDSMEDAESKKLGLEDANNRQIVRNSDITRERRKSISVDRSSLEQVQRKMDAAFQAVSCNSATAKRRLYIPSFAEFKKIRQFSSGDKYETIKETLPISHSLDTINEDEQQQVCSANGLVKPKKLPKVITVQECPQNRSLDVGDNPFNTTEGKDTADNSYWAIDSKGENSIAANADIDNDEVFMDDIELSSNKENCGDTTEERISPVLRSTSDVCSYSLSAEAQKRRIQLRKQRQCKSEPFIEAPRVETTHSQYLDNQKSICPNRLSDCGVYVGGNSLLSTSGNVSQTTSYLSLEDFDVSESETDSSCFDVDKCDKRLSNLSLTSNDSGVIGHDSSTDLTYQNPACSVSLPFINVISPSTKSVQPTAHDLDTISRPSSTSSSHPEEKGALCNDCLTISSMDYELENIESHSHLSNVACSKCMNRRMEQREIIQEILDTELNYRRDLNVLKEEFYDPMMLAGLLNSEQLEQVFSNLDELIHINTQFCMKLQSTMTDNTTDSNANTSNINIGCLFLEFSSMFSAFETYCINQPQANVVLEQLAKEKELLRIFLQVSQNENSALRRMHLKSFLMVPVQRIVKYPLLLSRLYKVTPTNHSDREDIKTALSKIEDILSRINSKTNYTTLRPKRKRPSENNRRQSFCPTEKNEVHKLALDMLGWKRKEVSDLICSKLWYGVPNDHIWASKKCKNIKFIQIHAVLLVQDKSKSSQTNVLERRGSTGMLFPNQSTSVEQAVVVLVREKNGKFQPVREPLALDKCVVTVDPECDEVFEIQEWGKESYLLKCEDPNETKVWVNHLKQQTRDLSQWRRRRNALPNIMLKQMA